MNPSEISAIGLKVGYLIFMVAISYKAYLIFKSKHKKPEVKPEDEE